MKRNFLISFTLIALMAISINSFGQKARSMQVERPAKQQAGNYPVIDNLSPDQQAKIVEIRTARQETREQYRTQMDELRTRKRSLQTQANPDMNAINQVIDQMTALRGEMMKNSNEHHQQIRSILTEEQRAQFDSQLKGPRAGREMRPQRGRRGN